MFRQFTSEKYGPWWYRELEYPALRIAASSGERIALQDVLGGECPVAGAQYSPSPAGFNPHQAAMQDGRVPPPPAPPGGGRAARQQAQRVQRAPRQHNVDAAGTGLTTSRRGTPVCAAYNSPAGCQPAVSGCWCPVSSNALHLCSRCLIAGHVVANCPRAELAPAPPAGKGKGGKGAGRGKGGKGKGGKQQRSGPYYG